MLFTLAMARRARRRSSVGFGAMFGLADCQQLRAVTLIMANRAYGIAAKNYVL
jgi:hypothetical protein